MVRKLFFAVGWVGIFIISALCIYAAVFPNYLYSMDFGSLIFRSVLTGVSLFYILLFVEKILLFFEKSKDYEVKNENGKLIVSSATINNLAKEVTMRDPEFKNVKVRNKIRGKKLFIYASVDAYSDSDIAKNVIDTQANVKKEIFDYLALEVEGVEVKVSKLLKRKSGLVPAEGSEL